MTQPAMYDIIDTKRSVRKTYTEALIGRGDISVDEAEKALRDFSSSWSTSSTRSVSWRSNPASPSPTVEFEQQVPARVPTAISRQTLERIADAHINLPPGFTPHPRVKPVLERRAKMAREGDIDWAFGELLAFGSLNLEGKLVRLAGQDSRGARSCSGIPWWWTARPAGVHAVAEPERRAGQVPGLRLGVVGVRGGRFRVRLLGGQPGTRWCSGRRSSVTSSTAPSR